MVDVVASSLPVALPGSQFSNRTDNNDCLRDSMLANAEPRKDQVIDLFAQHLAVRLPT